MEYRTEVAGIDADQLEGFFDGWPSPPTPAKHLAQLAGLRLRDRWAGWIREPFTSDSTQQVAVFEKVS